MRRLDHLTSNYVNDYNPGIPFLRMNPTLNFFPKFLIVIRTLNNLTIIGGPYF
jgi:hypothetical protein